MDRGATAIAALAGCFSFLQRRWPIPTTGEALTIGASWLAPTVAFEFVVRKLQAG